MKEYGGIPELSILAVNSATVFTSPSFGEWMTTIIDPKMTRIQPNWVFKRKVLLLNN